MKNIAVYFGLFPDSVIELDGVDIIADYSEYSITIFEGGNFEKPYYLITPESGSIYEMNEINGLDKKCSLLLREYLEGLVEGYVEWLHEGSDSIDTSVEEGFYSLEAEHEVYIKGDGVYSYPDGLRVDSFNVNFGKDIIGSINFKFESRW